MTGIESHRLFFFFKFVLVLLLTESCSNELELTTSSDPTPVVWCLLNPDAGVQYVRLGRSFLPDPGHPDLPPVADSTVWNLSIKVYVEEWRDSVPINTFWFNPVESPAKDSGFFPQENLRLFKADFHPARLSTYHLYVHFPDDYRIISGITTVPGSPIVYDPLEMPGRKITLQTGVQYTTRWAPGSGYGIYEGFFIINYAETINDQTSYGKALLRLDPILGLGAEIEMANIYSGNQFLKEIAAQIAVRSGAERSIINVQFKLYKGGEELALLASPDLETTTISNSLNQYTNLVNGIGVFSSMQEVAVNNLQLSNTTLSELAHSELTRNLGFKDIHGGELNPNK